MTDKAKVDALRKEYDKKRRFRNLAMVLANDASFGLYPMVASAIPDDGRTYDERLTDARGQIDKARSELSDFDQNLALGGSIAAPTGLGVLGRMFEGVPASYSKAMWAAGNAGRPVAVGALGAAGSYDPRLTPEEQKKQALMGALTAYLPAKAGHSFPEIRQTSRELYDAYRPKSPEPPYLREPPTLTMPPRSGEPGSVPPPRPPVNPGTGEGGRSVDELLAETDDLLKQLEETSKRKLLTQDVKLTPPPRQDRGRSYSPPPDRMQPTPPNTGPLKTPKLFSGQRPMSRDQLKAMAMAHGEFRASIDRPQAAFRAGKISEERFNEAARSALYRAAYGNNVDPRYLAEQIAKDQRRDPKGWALTFPEKN